MEVFSQKGAEAFAFLRGKNRSDSILSKNGDNLSFTLFNSVDLSSSSDET
jgi:hypothetical protein